jgi:hypothetical protein
MVSGQQLAGTAGKSNNARNVLRPWTRDAWNTYYISTNTTDEGTDLWDDKYTKGDDKGFE